jgi:hypothetical protein
MHKPHKAKVWLRFSSENPAGVVVFQKISWVTYLFHFFSVCLVVKTSSGGVTEFDVAPIRPNINSYYCFTTKTWGSVPNDHLVFSVPCAFLSVRLQGSSFFHVPCLYSLQDLDLGFSTVEASRSLDQSVMPQEEGAAVEVSRSLGQSVMPQEGVKVFAYSAAKQKIIPWSESAMSLQAAASLGIAIPSTAYAKRRHAPGSSFSGQEALVFERDLAGRSYPTIVAKQSLPNIGNILPVFAYELLDENALFFNPQFRQIWGLCTLQTMEQMDTFLQKSVGKLIVMFTGGVDTPSYRYYRDNFTLQQQLEEAALSLNFKLLVKMGFLRSKDVDLLEIELALELGLNLKLAPLPAISFDRSEEILYIKRALATDLIPGLVNGLSIKECDALAISKNPPRVTTDMATLICQTVWVRWQEYLKGSTRFM